MTTLRVVLCETPFGRRAYMPEPGWTPPGPIIDARELGPLELEQAQREVRQRSGEVYADALARVVFGEGRAR
jgi:hypothetical protein